MSQIKQIYVDPGHVGGEMLDLRSLVLNGIEFREGNFSFAWANALSERLRARQIDAPLTRAKDSSSKTLSTSDIDSRRADLQSLSIDAILKKFRVPRKFFPHVSDDELVQAAIQNEGDLLNRASLINRSDADFCLSLHLNGDPERSSTSENGICGLTNNNSSDLFPVFEKIIQSISQNTGLHIYKMKGLSEVSQGIFTDETLTLMKNVSRPILLIEGPFQNNPDELVRLNSSLKNYVETGKVTGRLLELATGIEVAL